MLTNLAPYPAYRDSGVPWLGDVPDHWEVRRVKAVVESVNQQITTVGAEAPYVALEHVKGWTGRVRTGTAPAGSAVKKFTSHDVLFGKLRPYLAKVTRLNTGGVCVGEFLVLRPREDDTCSGYVERLLRSKPIIDVINASTFGAKMPRADWTFIGSMGIPLPPPEEQAAIVRYLDHADRRIRRYIRAKQQLIALLEEQKQAIIHHAVTRGLDPGVRLKPSGVEWLGDIPEHWEVRRVKALFREVDRRSIHGREVLLSLRMKQGLVPHNDVSSVPIPESSLVGFKQVERGQLVMNRMRAAIGLFGVPGQSGLVSPDYAVFEPRTDLSLSFYLRLFKTPAMCGVFRTASKGLGTGSSGFMRLYTDQFGAITIPFPPSTEQHAIAQRIDTELAEIGRTQERLEAEIALLGEYRTRLIADVVTGKLDVREAAARLPEETDEAEPLDDLDLPDDDQDDLDAHEVEAELAEAVT